MSGYTLENDPAVEKLIMFCLAPAVLTGGLGFFAPQARGWLRVHAITVDPAQAMCTLPGGLGLDGPRIAFAVFVLLALVGIAMTGYAGRVLKESR